MEKLKIAALLIGIDVVLSIIGLLGIGMIASGMDIPGLGSVLFVEWIIVALEIGAIVGIMKGQKGWAIFILVLAILALLPATQIISTILLFGGSILALVGMNEMGN